MVELTEKTAQVEAEALSDSAPGNELAIELNHVLHMSSAVGGTRLKARLVGMVEQRLLIVQMLATDASASRFRASFPYGMEYLIRYLYKGTVFGFSTMVKGSSTDPEQLLFLSWPRTVQEQSIRSSRRVEMYIPCELDLDGEIYKATITDFSIHGCKCALIRQESMALPDPGESPGLLLSLATRENDDFRSIPGKVRQVRTDKTNIELGIAFDDPQNALFETLTAFMPIVK